MDGNTISLPKRSIYLKLRQENAEYMTSIYPTPLTITDFFGRGYSDAPADLPYDSRLYTSQILLALASSHLPWSGLSGFHLVGYSMGGGISVAFTRYFPHMVRSLTLICSSGLLRPSHVNWKFALLYTRTMLPEWLRAFIVKRRLLPEARHGKAAPEAEGAPRGARWGKGDSDASAGDAYDGAVLVEERPDATVAAVLAWHLVHHRGFLMAYMKSMRHAPLFNQQADWRTLGTILAKTRERKRDSSSVPPGSLLLDKVLLIMGESDPVIPKDEVVGDTLEVFGEDGIELLVLEGGHELPITKSAEVAAAVRAFGVRD